ncbi:DUF6162 family protein [Orrella sp. JC864]|uniref:DUF6162 family protein n=1 Tax=Orrella sp. JC864 TaxID=3120298 RepID=UPI0012BD608C
MAQQVVRPAGAGHETLAVLAACALILAGAGAYIGLAPAPQAAQALAAGQLDARRDLTPAEQGIYADLRVVHDELAYAVQAGLPLPDAAALAEEGLPPFAQDPSSAARGGHVWSDGMVQDRHAYLGRTGDAAVAGSFLLLAPAPPAHGHGHDGHGQAAEPEIWLRRDGQAALPAAAGAGPLARQGWQQVIAQFDAGVTREHRR